MTTVETAATSTAAAAVETKQLVQEAGSAQGATGVSSSGDTQAVSKELAALQTSTTSASSATSTTALVQKVTEALLSVLQALAGLVAALAPAIRARQDAAAPASSAATPQATGTASSSASGAQSAASTPSSAGVGTSSQQATSGAVSSSSFQVARNDIGQIAVRTLDGYIIRAEGKEEAWTITAPDGKTTRIWGDPHVKESDGNNWDFLTRATFSFGNNKVTAEVVPAGNGSTYTSRITIYSGDERVTIDGIDKNKPAIVAVSRDGKQHDDGLADGITYRRATTARGESWTSNQTGRVM